jgi:D-glycero-beta-D-manno-heptose-7-phosphate kinase
MFANVYQETKKELSEETLLKFKNIKNKSIAVIGDIMLDVYYDCIVDRISPEAPIPIVKTTEGTRTLSLGGAANVALNCNQMGIKTYLFGSMGTDWAKTEITNMLNLCGINYSYSLSKNPTVVKVRYRSGHHQIIRIDFEEENPIEIPEWGRQALIDSIIENSENFDAIIISDYNKGTITEKLCTKVIKFAESHSIPIFIDPKGIEWYKYEGATCITPNMKEFKAMCNRANGNLFVLEECARELMSDFAFENILITKGKDGMSLISEDQSFHLPTDAVEVFDVSGAGDTVISVFALAYISGYPITLCTRIANLAAKIAVKKKGTQPITLDELNLEFKNGFSQT